MSEKEKGREVRGIVLKERSFGFCSVDSSSFQASYISSLLVRSLVRWLALEKEKLPTSAGPTFLVPRGLIHPRILNRPSSLDRLFCFCIALSLLFHRDTKQAYVEKGNEKGCKCRLVVVVGAAAKLE
jgi:hypothetical protein